MARAHSTATRLYVGTRGDTADLKASDGGVQAYRNVSPACDPVDVTWKDDTWRA